MRIQAFLNSRKGSSTLITSIIEFAHHAVEGNMHNSKRALDKIIELTATSKLKPEQTINFIRASLQGKNKDIEAYKAEYNFGSKEFRQVDGVLDSLEYEFVRKANKAIDREKSKDLSLASNEVKEKLTQSLAQVSDKYGIPEAEILRNVISMLS